MAMVSRTASPRRRVRRSSASVCARSAFTALLGPGRRRRRSGGGRRPPAGGVRRAGQAGGRRSRPARQSARPRWRAVRGRRPGTRRGPLPGRRRRAGRPGPPCRARAGRQSGSPGPRAAGLRRRVCRRPGRSSRRPGWSSGGQVARRGVGRRELRGRPRRHHPAPVDDHHTVGHALRLVQFVGGEEHARPGRPQLGHHGPDDLPAVGIDARRGLVQEHHLRPADEGQGQREALLFAAGQPAPGGARRRPHQPEPLQQGSPGLRGPVVVAGEEVQRLRVRPWPDTRRPAAA